MKILFFGDIVGKIGRKALAKILPQLKAEFSPDLVLANVENLAHGKGITLATVEEMLEAEIDFFTSGNHVFDKPEAKDVFAKYGDKIIRPSNLPPDLPGAGSKILEVKGTPVLVINLLGQVFMEKQFDQGEITNPFHKLNELLGDPAVAQIKVRLLDFHAEATSEKRGMGLFADGRLSAVVGTHTHVSTADAQILREGTGYITDLGMTGAADSIIGVAPEGALGRFLNEAEGQPRSPLEVAAGPKVEAGFAVFQIDETSGKCKNINGYFRIF